MTRPASESAVANALLDLSRAAIIADVPWALVGGQALISYGVPRETLDVDALVSFDGIVAVVDALVVTFGWVPLSYDDKSGDYTQVKEPLVHHMDDPVLFDVHVERQMIPLQSAMGLVVELLAAQHPVEDAMIDAAAIRGHYGVKIPVAPLGGVLLVKMKADRKKDVAAVEQTAEHLDQAKVQEAVAWARRYDPATADDLASVIGATRARRTPLRKNPCTRTAR